MQEQGVIVLAQLAELFSIPARIVELTDAQSLEWQLVENSQRVDVHPYEEAQGFQQLARPSRLRRSRTWSRSQARAQATSTPVSHSCNSFPKWPKRSRRSASRPATPTSSPVYRRSHRPRHSSSAGARTGRTRSRTCYPPSTYPLGFRTTSISHLRMLHSTAKTPPSTPQQELASLAPVAADTTLPSFRT